MESSSRPTSFVDPDPSGDQQASDTNTPVVLSEENYQSFKTAIEEGDVSKLESLLIRDPKFLFVVEEFLDQVGTEAWPALENAAADFADVNGIIDAHCELDGHDNEGMNALHLACRYGHVKVAECLINSGANLDSCEAQGCTPFHVACMYGQLEVVELLWEKGPKSQISDENSFSNQALQMAVINNRLTTIQWLLEHGADISHQVGEAKKTALHYASAYGLVEVVKLLLAHKANIHVVDAYLNTPLLEACWDPQPDIFTLLHDEGALASHVNIHDRNGFHAVILSDEPFCEHHKAVLKLLVGVGADINKRDQYGFSALYLASRDGKGEIVECLLDLGADVNQKSTLIGSTALMEACCSPFLGPVEVLLRRGADLTPVNHHGMTALTLACVKGHLTHVEALMRKGIDVTVCNREGHRPLCAAAEHGHTDIVLRILKSPRYYSRYPADVIDSVNEGIFMMNVTHDGEIEKHLLHAFEENRSGISASLNEIMYWAVAHGRIDLASKCISGNSEVLKWSQEKANWLHVAAQHAQSYIITSLFFDLDASQKASSDVTPLHLAALSGSRKTSSVLLEQIGTQSKDQSAQVAKVMAILVRDGQGASPLDISIRHKHSNVTETFWGAIRDFGTSEKTFMQTDPSHAILILETLAQYEKPGNEKVLGHLLQQWCTNLSLTEAQKEGRLITPLDWAVYCSQPTVVWWLLSKEGYSSNVAIENSLWLAQHSEDAGVRAILAELLKYPLPVLGNIANPNDDPLLELPQPPDMNDPALVSSGTIVEVYSDGTIRTKQGPSPTIADIIYKYGPDKIMEEATDLDLWHLNALKKRIRNCQLISGSTRRLFNTSSSSDPRNSSGSEPKTVGRLDRQLQLRWIHLPVTQLRFMQDLLSRLSCDSRRPAKDHQALMRHFNRSWTDLAAGGGQRYMKPQCVKDVDTSRVKDSGEMSSSHSPCIALYMPYLSLGYYEPPARRDTCRRRDDGGAGDYDHRPKPTNHAPMTLDQYYYPTLTETDARDKDQVLSKYLEWKAPKADQQSITSTITKFTHQTAKDQPLNILKVDQIWMWIIDENTIITASTEAKERNENSKGSLLQTVLDSMIYGEKRGTFERPRSVHSMMDLILGVATGFFARKFVPLPDRLFKTPLEVFRESLRHAADEEIFLYQKFLRELNGQKGRDPQDDASLSNHLIKDMPSNPLSFASNPHSISPEAKVLDKIRDIRDELHMLRSLAEDQELVWKQAFEDQELKDTRQYYQPCTPADVKKDLDDMLGEVETINNSINTLLDLRQKQASISQANDTAKQSNTVFVFTVITIVRWRTQLPLSFLSSLFALDISSFPHEGDSLRYPGWWLFPILFGASAIISLPTIFLAWKVNDISEWFRRSNLEVSKRKDHLSSVEDKELEEQTAHGLRSLARRAMNSRRNGSHRTRDAAGQA
ncbi:Mg2+ transporter like zinc transport [Fusarium heterosporum]|uniref:Mg2+ transporter like zinc transport n=1 Tax=Fusarium heterosporum TaxID=42747 RepID=A0A8H5T0T3_FUSHE|nr:Mg2+ transporter like zinc transport [Fusarium heterosporum]